MAFSLHLVIVSVIRRNFLSYSIIHLTRVYWIHLPSFKRWRSLTETILSKYIFFLKYTPRQFDRRTSLSCNRKWNLFSLREYYKTSPKKKLARPVCKLNFCLNVIFVVQNCGKAHTRQAVSATNSHSRDSPSDQWRLVPAVTATRRRRSPCHSRRSFATAGM